MLRTCLASSVRPTPLSPVDYRWTICCCTVLALDDLLLFCSSPAPCPSEPFPPVPKNGCRKFGGHTSDVYWFIAEQFAGMLHRNGNIMRCDHVTGPGGVTHVTAV